METVHTLATVLMDTKEMTVMVSFVFCFRLSLLLHFLYGNHFMQIVITLHALCYMYFCFIETNPACSNITCQNGGSCIHINETNNAVCACNNNFGGQFCEGIKNRNLGLQILPSQTNINFPAVTMYIYIKC